MAVLLSNNAISKLASSLTTGATSLSLTAGTGALFPSPSGGNWFPVTVINSAGALEIMRCTARSTDTLTVTRAQESTTAKAFSAGDRVELRLTVAALNAALADFQPIASNLTALSGLAGAANKLPIFTGAGAMSLQTLSSFMATLLDDADAATARATLGADNAGNLTSGIIPNARVSVGLSPDQAFRRGNILGTVAQSGGVPTGALIETGSNANGTYIRFADGTQICHAIILAGTITLAAGAISSSYSWTFPSVFVGNYTRVFAKNQSVYSYEHVCEFEATSSTGVSGIYIKNIGTSSRTLDHNIHLFAVDRWF